jgi:cytoskeletal protein CcmA (bactofilin family)
MSTKEERVTTTVITSDLKITENVETTNKLLIKGEVLGEVRGSI